MSQPSFFHEIYQRRFYKVQIEIHIHRTSCTATYTILSCFRTETRGLRKQLWNKKETPVLYKFFTRNVDNLYIFWRLFNPLPCIQKLTNSTGSSKKLKRIIMNHHWQTRHNLFLKRQMKLYCNTKTI